MAIGGAKATSPFGAKGMQNTVRAFKKTTVQGIRRQEKGMTEGFIGFMMLEHRTQLDVTPNDWGVNDLDHLRTQTESGTMVLDRPSRGSASPLNEPDSGDCWGGIVEGNGKCDSKEVQSDTSILDSSLCSVDFHSLSEGMVHR